MNIIDETIKINDKNYPLVEKYRPSIFKQIALEPINKKY
jgi:hypothetical protein